MGSGGLGGACSVWVGFGDAAESDFEAEGSELADVAGDPCAAMVPDTGIMQVFYRGPDNSLRSFWRDPSSGTWEGEQTIGGVLACNPCAEAITP